MATAGNVSRLFQTMLSDGPSQTKYGPQVYLHLLAIYIKKLQEMVCLWAFLFISLFLF
jgi:hypothetical protein